MAKDKTPDAWIASFAESGGTITFPLASVTGLTSGDCNTSSGDIRMVLYRLLETIRVHQEGLADADKLATVTITKLPSPTAVEFRIRLTTATSSFTLATDT